MHSDRRKRKVAFNLMICMMALCMGCSHQNDHGDLPATVSFNFHIKPILSDRCFACHGPDAEKREADLRLDESESALRQVLSQGGHAFVPGKPHRSIAWQRMQSDDPELQMPPPESNLTLNDRELALIERWIEQGATYEPHWSFIPPKKVPAPTDADHWATNAIDAFVLEKMQQHGLEPSSPADRRTLIRRVTFDLTGLPPTPEAIDQFLADTSDDAYTHLVERLLDSPTFGERMAAHWLEVARFSDSEGYLDDYHHAMWPYRDWVIEAFNRNIPYDRFILWQMGGDQMPEPTQEQVLATAFNRNHKHNSEGGIIPEEFRVEYVADRTHTLGRAFLGLTLECARCHDHKYDPISQEDYYRFYAFFNSVVERGDGIFGANALERSEPVPNRYAMNPGPVLALTTPEIDSIRAFLAAQIDTTLRAIATKFDQPTKVPPVGEMTTWQRNITASLNQKSIVDLRFDHAPGGVIRNHADPARSGKLNGLQLVEGKYGQAIRSQADRTFTMDGSRISFERYDPFAVSFWIYVPKHFDEAHVLFNGNGRIQGYRGWDVMLEDNRLSFRINHAHPYQSLHRRTRDSLQTETWYHFVISYDGSSRAAGMQMYQNGKPIDAEVVYDHLYRSTVPLGDRSLSVYMPYSGFRIGNRHYDQDFTGGRIDELQIFTGTLSALEAAYLARGDSALTELQQMPNTEATTLAAGFFHNNQDPEVQKLRQHLQTLQKRDLETIDTVREIMVMEDLAKPRATYLLDRGVYDQPRQQVYPETPGTILPYADTLPTNRYGLGQWLIHPAHPLTARVAVNQFWQLIFGKGIVGTTEDFGSQGDLPTHPELLDWLAVDFVESGWDVKRFIRMLVLSSTYRQSSVISKEHLEKDPDNDWLARSPRYRLPAEMVRDNILAMSGLLDTTIGGRSVFPYQPKGLWLEISNKSYFKPYAVDTVAGLYRRSIYSFWKRNLPPPTMLIFDAHARSECQVRRVQTNTPLQALVLLNDPQTIEACRVLACKTMIQTEHPQDALPKIFAQVTGRPPGTVEESIIHEQWQSELAYFQQNPEKAEAYLETGFQEVPSEMTPETVAAMTVVTNTILNSTEGYYKN